MNFFYSNLPCQLSIDSLKKNCILLAIMIDADKISEVIKKIVAGYNPEKIILFGSYAIGNQDENSDLDLFVIKDSDLPRPQRTFFVRKILLGTGIPIDIIVYTPSEIEKSKDDKHGFVYQVLNYGKTLYERSN